MYNVLFLYFMVVFSVYIEDVQIFVMNMTFVSLERSERYNYTSQKKKKKKKKKKRNAACNLS